MHGFETQIHREVEAGLPSEFVLVPLVVMTGIENAPAGSSGWCHPSAGNTNTKE